MKTLKQHNKECIEPNCSIDVEIMKETKNGNYFYIVTRDTCLDYIKYCPYCGEELK